MKVIILDKKDSIPVLLRETFSLMRNDFNIEEGGLGDFTIAQYSEDGDFYIEITLDFDETQRMIRFLEGD